LPYKSLSFTPPFPGKPKLSDWASSSYGAVPRSVPTIEKPSEPDPMLSLSVKFEGGVQELEETLNWLELFEESGIVVGGQVSILPKEANELMAIMVASVKTAKRIS